MRVRYHVVVQQISTESVVTKPYGHRSKGRCEITDKSQRPNGEKCEDALAPSAERARVTGKPRHDPAHFVRTSDTPRRIRRRRELHELGTDVKCIAKPEIMKSVWDERYLVGKQRRHLVLMYPGLTVFTRIRSRASSHARLRPS